MGVGFESPANFKHICSLSRTIRPKIKNIYFGTGIWRITPAGKVLSPTYSSHKTRMATNKQQFEINSITFVIAGQQFFGNEEMPVV